jgi:hypothetical protein
LGKAGGLEVGARRRAKARETRLTPPAPKNWKTEKKVNWKKGNFWETVGRWLKKASAFQGVTSSCPTAPPPMRKTGVIDWKKPKW